MSACKRCGEPITGRAKQARYCGTRCQDATYRDRHRDHINAYNRTYREANWETLRGSRKESMERWRNKNRAASVDYSRKYREANKESGGEVQTRADEIVHELTHPDPERALQRANDLLDFSQDNLTRRAMTTGRVQDLLVSLLEDV